MMEERDFNIDEKLISKAEKEYEDELEKTKITDNIAKSSVDCRVIQPNSFINGDCMEFMRTCPPNFFDLAIVDPPYDIANNASRHGGSGKLKNRILNKGSYKMEKWDKRPPAEYFEQLFRISKNQIIWGGNYYKLEPSRCWLIWDKEQPFDNFSDFEMAWTSFSQPNKMYRQRAVETDPEGKIHPTQKTVKLYRWILKHFGRAGDLILDTHVGSASSLIACTELGYDYVGFEIDKEYYEMAKSRLGRATRKYELFEAV